MAGSGGIQEYGHNPSMNAHTNTHHMNGSGLIAGNGGTTYPGSTMNSGYAQTATQSPVKVQAMDRAELGAGAAGPNGEIAVKGRAK